MVVPRVPRKRFEWPERSMFFGMAHLDTSDGDVVGSNNALLRDNGVDLCWKSSTSFSPGKPAKLKKRLTDGCLSYWPGSTCNHVHSMWLPCGLSTPLRLLDSSTFQSSPIRTRKELRPIHTWCMCGQKEKDWRWLETRDYWEEEEVIKNVHSP